MPGLDSIIKEFIRNEEYITNREIKEDEIILDVKFPRQHCICPNCKSTKHEVKDYRVQKVALRMFKGVPVYARIQKRRLRCYVCGHSFYQPISFLKRNQRRSTAILRLIAREYEKGTSLADLSKRYGVSSSAIRHAHQLIKKKKEKQG